VVRHANLSGRSLSGRATLFRAPLGDVRGSSSNNPIDLFIGDYNYAMATNSGAVSVWNDARATAVCPAMNTYRQAVANGDDPPAPAPATACPATFGNTDIFGSVSADPTP
jgi:hypothetical protein